MPIWSRLACAYALHRRCPLHGSRQTALSRHAHLESLQNEFPATLLVLLHNSPGAGCALPEGAAHQALLSKASPQLAPAALHLFSFCGLMSH